ncbi:MAG: GFA family protein [Devosia sp.]
MSAQDKSGHCLCGAVRFTATVEKDTLDVCHCTMCRRWSGGPIMAVGAKTLTFEDPSKVAAYTSSDWGERIFCPTCGTSLAWRMRDGSHVSVMAYAFDDGFDPQMELEIFIDQKPTGYGFKGDHPTMTKDEVVAHFMGSGS